MKSDGWSGDINLQELEENYQVEIRKIVSYRFRTRKMNCGS